MKIAGKIYLSTEQIARVCGIKPAMFFDTIEKLLGNLESDTDGSVFVNTPAMSTDMPKKVKITYPIQ
jgi:hypothetical protein